MSTANEDNWTPRDFVDNSAPISPANDPWDPQSLSLSSPSPTAPATRYGATVVEPTSEDSASDMKVAQSHSPDAPALSSAAPTTEDTEFDIPPEWFAGEAEEEQETEALESPLPVLEYDPNLAEGLYQIAEFIDLTDVELRLDLLLANVGLSAEEDLQVRNHLKTFSNARLSNWLPWLASKVWTGRTLLMFVQFHIFWEGTPEWWESRWYFRRFGWQCTRSPMSNILTRDDAYRLVHRRRHLRPEEMMDPVWFEEWDYHSLWRHGFFSFASFACFRSGLNEGEDWKSLIAWRSPEEDLELSFRQHQSMDWEVQQFTGNLPTAEDMVPTYSYSSSLPRWYVIQDWHPEREWHDNLGWNMPSQSFADFNTSPGTSPGPMWPIGGRDE